MSNPTTELSQRCPPPPYAHWDQRGKPVLLSDLKLIDHKQEAGRARLRKFIAEIRRLKALSQAEYGSKSPASAKHWRLPVGIIHCLTGRKPTISRQTHASRRMRDRRRGKQLPMWNTWEHRPQGGKGYGWNGKVLTARQQIGGRPWQWSLKTNDGEKAEALMGPVRVARQHLRQAATEHGKYELGTDAKVAAAVALMGARAELARAIHAAGGRNELVEFVAKGPQQEVGTAVPQRASAVTVAPNAAVSATKRRQAAEEKCRQLLIERHQTYLRDGRRERPFKDELRIEMRGLIPNLSRMAFDRAWKATVVAEGWDWKDPGFRGKAKPLEKNPLKKPPKK